MENTKPFLPLCRQVEKLKERNCRVPDEHDCEYFLLSVNYYRLTAYFLPFKGQDDLYHDDVSISRIKRIYDFDNRLRHLIFEILTDIEIYFRSTLAYYFAGKYGPLGYLNKNNFNSRYSFDEAVITYHREIERNRNMLFVKHHLENKNGVFPLWVICELFSFGDTSRFYAGLMTRDKKIYSKAYFRGINYKTLESWMKCGTELRNICAHHGRLYYRIFAGVPSRSSADNSKGNFARLWEYMQILSELHPDPEKWNSYISELDGLIQDYSNDIELKHINYPENWRELLIKDI